MFYQVLAKVQIKAINMISGLTGTTYTDKLKELGIHSLYDRRVRFDMIQTYKIINRVKNVESSTWFQLVYPTRTTTTRQSAYHLNIQPKRSNLEIRSQFFSNRVVEGWNKLPNNIKDAPNLKKFKILYDQTWKEI